MFPPSAILTMKLFALFFASAPDLSFHGHEFSPPSMQCALAMRAVIPLRAAIAICLASHLLTERSDLGMLDLKGCPIFCLPIAEVDIDLRNHLDAMPVFSTDEAYLLGMMFDLRKASLPPSCVVHTC